MNCIKSRLWYFNFCIHFNATNPSWVCDKIHRWIISRARTSNLTFHTSREEENQTDSTAKFQLFFHLQKKTFYFSSIKKIVYSREEKAKTSLSLCISLRCLPRAFKNNNRETDPRAKKRSSQIFYYYFSTPIFYVGIFISLFLNTKKKCFRYTKALDVVYRRGSRKKKLHSEALRCWNRQLGIQAVFVLVKDIRRSYVDKFTGP